MAIQKNGKILEQLFLLTINVMNIWKTSKLARVSTKIYRRVKKLIKLITGKSGNKRRTGNY